MTCGHCGGGFAKVTTANFGCSNARSKGKAVCSNMATLSQDELEKLVLATLQNNLMDKGALAELLMLSMETKQQTGKISKTQGTE
jgi:hypothetical protein